ncbi:hypothetical protein RSD66_04080 [Brevundimonas sp. S1H14]|uniref:hypothetical protein n=1 Tax=Brevundimonas sp. S1H14 TaxID=3078084 RepID=UPI0039EAA8D8
MSPMVWYGTAELIAADFRAGAARREQDALWWAAEGEPFSEVLDRAGRARMANGKRHPHQRRLTRKTIDACAEALFAISAELERTTCFHEVFDLVRKAFAPIRGAGELAVYDAADRICKRLGHASEHVIYLHAGARVGARRLLGGRLPNGDAWGIMYHQVPENFRAFSTHEIEDILCRYKDDFSLEPEALRAKWAGASTEACEAGGSVPSSC